MQKEIHVAAFEGGVLRMLESGEKSREAVLALPLSRLLVQLVRVPAGEEAVATALPVLKALSPYPDEELTVGCETIREMPDGGGTVVLAAALPEEGSDDIGEALDAAKVNVTRIDLLAAGELRGVWQEIGATEGAGARRVILLTGADCLSLFVLDDCEPVAVRAVDARAELRREIMLSLLTAEDFGGARALTEIVVFGETEVAGLEQLAPVRRLAAPGADVALLGVKARAAEPATLDALPAAWREVLDETRFKRKLTRNLSIAGGVWAMIMAVLFGVPLAFGFMTDYQKGLSRQHKRQYDQVHEMKEKIDLVRKYSDHARGALEIMKAVSDRLPEGITLSSWTYKRDEGVRVAGESEDAEAVYKFKDNLDAIQTGGEAPEGGGEAVGGEKLFKVVDLNGPSASKNGQKFDIDCQYHAEGEE